MGCALITHADCLDHLTPDGHPEQVARLDHVLHALQGLDLLRLAAPRCEDRDILRVHPQAYLDRLSGALPGEGLIPLDEDTWLSPRSLEAARRAVGGAVRAVDAVLAGEVKTAFCATRPPGHHAEAETPMGFCLFGNAAIAAKHALDHHGLERVAIVDFDVHHGNGTQALLWDEPRALVVTSQQYPLWPGTGAADETGGHHNVLNLPLPPGSGGAEMRAAYAAQAFPRLEAFRPELVIVSAGFDAHADDPLAELNWHEEDFEWLTRELCRIAQGTAQGRVVSLLEGGYDLRALADSARVHVEELIEAGR
ncbi:MULTISPECIES: histone deacetylase family protein [unclassified Salipiger]|uniref:histone deacetylase family protein n=1 Tax=unclassified Salipiger TaxID=2640570 RepID=UPI0013BAD0E1|nr:MULTISPECIES: histone deacetylase family protein [unclassified Salipiger]NDV49405.1 histone deacetylase family protein [Salipiger sp. PrR003]NDW32539.1 histone deacetylase family protein [Salipiger sp. PrR007]